MVLALWLGSYLLVPWVVKSQLEKQGSALLGREVKVASVEFKPWALWLALNDLSVAANPATVRKATGTALPVPQPPQLHIHRVAVDADLSSLWQLGPVVDSITVDAPRLRLTRLAQGGYDVDDILARLNQPSPHPASKPLAFALYNLALNGGSLDFNDQAVAQTHALRDLTISLPFLSNLASQREVKVAPHLAFSLNGAHFDTAAEGTPFAQTRKTDASFKVTDLDLQPYLPYLPAQLPVKLQSALLSVDLEVGFEQTPANQVRVTGTVLAKQLKLSTPANQPLFELERLKVSLADVRPLERVVKLAAVELQAPRLSLQREANGQLQWPRAADAAPKAANTRERTTTDTEKPSDTAWQFALQHLTLQNGVVRWQDAAVQPQASVTLNQLAFDATNIAWPLTQPVPFQGDVLVEGAGGAAPLHYKGSANLQAAQATASVAALPLSMAAPYLAEWLVPTLNGQLNADVGVSWKTLPQQPDELTLSLSKLVLDKLRLTPDAKSSGPVLAAVQQLALTSATVSLTQHTVRLGAVTVKAPKAAVERGADGRWMFERWLKPQASQTQQTDGKQAPAATPVQAAVKLEKSWNVAVDELAVEDAALAFSDNVGGRPVALDIQALSLNLKNIVPDSDKPSPLILNAKLAAGQLEPGTLAVRGTLALQPLAFQAQVDAKRLPAHALAPYAGEALRMDLLRADASYAGQVQFAQAATGPTVKLTGDVTLEDFRANTLARARDAQPSEDTPAQSEAPRGSDLRVGNELLSWKALAVRGVDLSSAPGSPLRVNVREISLSDFFARVILRASGQLNLQELVGPAPTAAVQGAQPVQPGTSTQSPGVAAADPNAPVVNIGPVSVVNGSVYFSDHFIKPNYSADLTELTGRLGGFSSAPAAGGAAQLADLALRGRAEGSASLDIVGKLNPLAKPLALDIQGKVRDLELPPLSTYAIKYAGHSIERGKLSMDVGYLIKPDGHLTATNKLVLNQMRFGNQVEGATASLPVRLAVALLADRNGVIDLDLPISGSLNDPQFSIGPTIFKAIVNLIGKALTAPFSLLAGAMGGSADELSTVSFMPGSAQLTPEAQQTLDKVAKALVDRPALNMTVVGTASEAFQHERLLAQLRAERRRLALVSGTSKATASPAEDANALQAGVPVREDLAAPLSAAEYPILLKSLYQRADIVKPRNAIGLAKDIPLQDMESLLLANLPVSPDGIRQLALQRQLAVKEYLVAKQVPSERLFLVAPRMVTPDAKSDVKWAPRAELSLAVR